MVEFEFRGVVFTLTDDQATLLAERLRNYAKGKREAEVKRVSKLCGSGDWALGALAVADFTEEILVGNLCGPLPLEGKAAEATFWTLRMIQALGESFEPTDAAALRDALAEGLATTATTAKRAA